MFVDDGKMNAKMKHKDNQSLLITLLRQIHLPLFGGVSLFNGISTFVRLFNAKAILLLEEQ